MPPRLTPPIPTAHRRPHSVLESLVIMLSLARQAWWRGARGESRAVYPFWGLPSLRPHPLSSPHPFPAELLERDGPTPVRPSPAHAERTDVGSTCTCACKNKPPTNIFLRWVLLNHTYITGCWRQQLTINWPTTGHQLANNRQLADSRPVSTNHQPTNQPTNQHGPSERVDTQQRRRGWSAT